MRNKDYSLEELVYAFLQNGKEGDCWDFKQEWHEDMPSLIKDIICFANTVHDEDCYLIFGVSDNLEITGMQKDRRKQADILDALSNVMFAGDVVLQIAVDSIQYEGQTLDILTVFNTNSTPVYLKKPYGKMHTGCIYLRNGDRNTPDNGNAEIHQIEDLWRKRFGLTKPPLDYAFDRLQNKLEWKESGDYYYNIYKPELVLHSYFDDEISHGADEFYVYSQTNESCTFGMMDILSSGTVLYSRQLVWLDSGRLCVPVPKWGFIDIDQWHINHISYKYYIRNSNIHRLQQFLYDPADSENRWAWNRFMSVILMFNSEEEREAFEIYVRSNIERLQEAVDNDDSYDYIVTENDTKTASYKESLRFGKALNQLLNEMRSLAK